MAARGRRPLSLRLCSLAVVASVAGLCCQVQSQGPCEATFVPGGRREATAAMLLGPPALLVASTVAPPAMPAAAEDSTAAAQVSAALDALKELKVDPCWDRDDTKCGPTIKQALGTTGGGTSPVYSVVKGGLQQIKVEGLPKVSDVIDHFQDLDQQADYWIQGPSTPGPYWDQAGVNARRALGQLIDDLEDAVDAIGAAG
mmetsp:Transcript_106326/g.295846  ORF Transcript_106326/g.295846 Transcript_106326/m.295846 type:complete len:200 (-) Transcript_106326:155-754(-)